MTQVLELSHIKRCLSAHEPTRLPLPSSAWDRASVALALSGPHDDLSMCFIQRAQRHDDPWSGQMALPGGRASHEDPNAMGVAVRETFEEVGVPLQSQQCLGALSDFSIGRGEYVRNGVLSPFVFYVGQETPTLSPEVAEVAAAFWIDLEHLWGPGNWSKTEWGDAIYPGIDYQGQLIWGLTLRVLAEFARVLARPLPVVEPRG